MKKALLVSAALVYSMVGAAQVDDVSLTIAPTAGYNWFDSKSTVENGPMYGLQAGFGFGKVIELRGIYERSANLKQTFGQYEGDIQNHFPDFDFANRSVEVTRIGGEFKTNLPFGRFSPYLILGTGMQTFERELESGTDYKNENLYGSGGLGLKFNMGNRTTFNIEGRGIVYNMNPGSLLYNDGGTADFDNWIGNQDRNSMYNWSLMAGLQFYFGGRNEGELSEMDRAYLRRFSGGLSGTKVTFSPVAGYLQFNDNSPYRDSYFLGGMLGIDLTDFVGLRGYYYQTTENEKISLDFDKLALYGADFVGKLNVPRGIVPYISIGGGYLHAHDNYQNKLTEDYPLAGLNVPSSYYAKGGVGVEIPLSRNLQLFGAANILYTMDKEGDDITKIRHSDELAQHQMYQAGLRFNFGKRADTRAYEYDAQRAAQNVDRRVYDEQVRALEQELKTAYENNDTEKVVEIMEQKKAIDSLQTQPVGETKYIRLTPAELESLIDKVLNGLEEQSEQTVETRLDRIERLLLQTPPQRVNEILDSIPTTSPQFQDTDYNRENLKREIELLRRQLQEQGKEIDALRNIQSVVQPLRTNAISDSANNVESELALAGQLTDFDLEDKRQVAITPYIGANFGGDFAFNTGIRANYSFNGTSLEFMPEAYVAWGDKVGFGASANGVYPFRSSLSDWTPYVGVGVGIHKQADDLTFHPNVIAGASYTLGSGDLTVDYTVRGLFKNNQLALGYRFNF